MDNYILFQKTRELELRVLETIKSSELPPKAQLFAAIRVLATLVVANKVDVEGTCSLLLELAGGMLEGGDDDVS